MKTYSEYIGAQEASLTEAASSLASLDAAKVEALPERPKSLADLKKAFAACPNYKIFERKAKALGCTVKPAPIMACVLASKVGGYCTDFEVEAPRESKTKFWLRIDGKSSLGGFGPDFMKMSMYAQVQPELYGSALDDAVKEIVKIKEFVQWFNSQDIASILPVFKEKA